MWAEKRSLKRFLIFYLTSTFFLIGVGEYFYYVFSKNKLVEEEKYYIKSELRYYLTKNPELSDIVKLKKLKSEGILNVKIAVYKNNRYMYGDFKPQKIYFNNESWVENGIVYFLLILPKKWGKIYILCSKPIDKMAMGKLKKELLLFSLFAFFFVSSSAYVLGKIFLSPMKEAMRNLEEFIEDVVHEINTPLSVIINNIEILQLKGIDSDEVKRIKSSSMRISKIFKDLVFVRFNHNLPTKIESINLGDLIKERLNFFEHMMDAKGLKSECRLYDVKIEADREDMVRVVDNLVSNAIKYSPRNSNLSIEVSEISGVARLIVKNTGTIKDTDEVTKKFVRDNKSEGGFGLGLYIVRKICEKYGFEFKLKSFDKDVLAEVIFRS